MWAQSDNRAFQRNRANGRGKEIKILLMSHAHWDHIAGSAKMKRLTGAKFEVMEGDAAVVESGGAKDFAYPTTRYPAAKVDRVLHDGDKVRLGGIVLTAHLRFQVRKAFPRYRKPQDPNWIVENGVR